MSQEASRPDLLPNANIFGSAMSKYFEWACTRPFGAAQDQTDNFLRANQWQSLNRPVPNVSDHPRRGVTDFLDVNPESSDGSPPPT